METEYGRVEVFPLGEAIGRSIICDDGITRTVRNISHSFRYKDRVIINEQDAEDVAGYFCHTLSLACQIHGDPLPTEEQKRAFTRMVQALHWKEDKKTWRVSKNGLLMWS